jgi:hypothetical protein
MSWWAVYGEGGGSMSRCAAWGGGGEHVMVLAKVASREKATE